MFGTMASDSDPPVQELDSPTKGSSFDDALRFFQNLTPELTRGNDQVFLSLEKIVSYSMNHGLTPEQITLLIRVIVSTKNKLTQAVRSKLVKCLVPSTTVPQKASVTALLAIAPNIFRGPGPSPLHNLLLRWVLLTYDYIDGYDQLHSLYNVVFTFINSIKMLPYACQLLFMLTRKQDVQYYKVQKLLQLIKEVGPEPCIMGLLLIYKVFCNHLVPMTLEYGHKVFFKAHDAVWRATITGISRLSDAYQGERSESAQQIQCRKDKACVQPLSKRRKLTVPPSHTAAMEIEETADLDSAPEKVCKIPITQIDTFTQFLESLEKIQYPSQIAAALSDSRLQLLLACDLNPIVMARLCFWIQHFFTYGFKENSVEDIDRNEKMLKLLHTFSQNVQCLPVVEHFLSVFLRTWNGESYMTLIFSLITWVRPFSFDDLHNMVLQPLQKLFFSGDVYFKAMCALSLTKLVRNLAIETRVHLTSPGQTEHDTTNVEHNDLSLNPDMDDLTSGPDSAGDDGLHSTEGPNSAGDDGLHSTSGPDSAGETHTTSQPVRTRRPESSGAKQFSQVIFRLIGYLDRVFVVGMRMESDHYLLQNTTLDFLELISQTCQKYKMPVIFLPMRVIRRLLFSDSPATLARLCSVINLFREAFGLLGDLMLRTSSAVNVGSNSRVVFNGLLLDVIGMLWKGHLFGNRDSAYPSMFSISISLPPHVREIVPENGFTLYRGPAFLFLAFKFLKETQKEGKKVHPVLIKEFKDEYLQFLEREGFPQFKQLVINNCKTKSTGSVHLATSTQKMGQEAI